MKPSRHVIVSLSAGLILWVFTKSIYAGVLCFLSGVLVDFDHIIEYIVHHGLKTITIKRVYQASIQTGEGKGELRFKKLYLIFHAHEIALLLIILTVFTRNVYLLAITIGYSTHLIMDCAANPLSIRSHSIIWRAANKFDTDIMYKKEKKCNGKN